MILNIDQQKLHEELTYYFILIEYGRRHPLKGNYSAEDVAQQNEHAVQMYRSDWLFSTTIKSLVSGIMHIIMTHPTQNVPAEEVRRKINEVKEKLGLNNFEVDESEISPAVVAHPIGVILRYSDGPTALMRVDSVSLNHGGKDRHYYHGQHCLGGLHAAYHHMSKVATQEEFDRYFKGGL